MENVGEYMRRIEQALDEAVAENKPFTSGRFGEVDCIMLGRTLDKRGGYMNPKCGHHYGPHNVPEFVRRNLHVYMRNPLEGSKPDWVKDLYSDALAPLIECVDPEFAGDDGDWAVQINVITDGAIQVINQHMDKDDITYQYGMALGEFAGGELTVWSVDALKTDEPLESCSIHNRIVRIDGRCWHQVEPVTRGHRYSIYYFKCYDRRPQYEKVTPVQSGIHEVFRVDGGRKTEDKVDDAERATKRMCMGTSAMGKNVVQKDSTAEEYEVEAILGEHNGKFRVKWKGYAETEATWEPGALCAGCPELIASFRQDEELKRLREPSGAMGIISPAPVKGQEVSLWYIARNCCMADKKPLPALDVHCHHTAMVLAVDIGSETFDAYVYCDDQKVSGLEVADKRSSLNPLGQWGDVVHA